MLPPPPPALVTGDPVIELAVPAPPGPPGPVGPPALPPITYPTIINDGADPVVWSYIISWNDTKYQADNTTGWEAIKSNDESETPTKYNWNGTAWVSE